MKYVKRILVLFLCAFTLLLPMPVSATTAFNIEDYYVEMKVHEDGRVEVHERIDTDFFLLSHGLYRNIPIRYDMDWGEMGKKTYYFPVSDISVSNEQYETETSSEGVQIKIGDPDRYVSGEKSYDIYYTVQTRDLDIDQDYFYFNLIGGFDCMIYGASFKIELPKSFDATKLQTYLEGVETNVEGNTITGYMNEAMLPNQYLTVYLPLGENYFEFEAIPNYSMIVILVSMIALALSFLLYLKFGVKEKPIVSVEFSAPDNLGSAGVGYVIDGVVNDKDVLSMIIDFANRGYLTIYDSEHDTILTKKKEMDEKCNGYEKSFFKALFDNRDEVSCEELKEQHFGDQIQVSKGMVRSHFQTHENKVFTGSSVSIQVVLMILAGMAVGLLSFAGYYQKVGMIEVAIVPLLILWPLMSASMVFWIILSRQKYAYSKGKIIAFSLLAVICHIAVFLGSLFFIHGWIGRIFVIIYTLLVIYMIATCGKRTEQGNRWLGQILGLKTFIQEAEKDQLEMLVNDNPSYFYHILPYAYVLGISDTWSKKFESINLVSPDWYTSYNSSTFSTIFWMSRFNTTMSALNALPGAITPSSSGTGGFSGGGGGFSGGGFGGGGGGSW